MRGVEISGSVLGRAYLASRLLACPRLLDLSDSLAKMDHVSACETKSTSRAISFDRS